jgi:hypothetical protein
VRKEHQKQLLTLLANSAQKEDVLQARSSQIRKKCELKCFFSRKSCRPTCT